MLGKSKRRLQRYIEDRISADVPAGWRVSGNASGGWTIRPKETRPFDPYYDLFILEGTLVITYGNTDVGPLGLHHYLLNAKIITEPSLTEFGLRHVLEDVTRNCEPNGMGYT